MRLQTYLDLKALSYADFARLIGPVSEFGVKKWALGQRVPRREAMRRIEQVTQGDVGPADFFPAATGAAA